MRETILKYGVSMPMRYTKAQKKYFVSQLIEDLHGNGCKVSIDKKKVGIQTHINVIVGDLSKAKKVFVSAYDTPSKCYIKNYLYYPFNVARNVKNENINFGIQIVIFIVCSILLLLSLIGFSNEILVYKIIFAVSSILNGFIIYQIAFNNANKVNMSRSSISVSTLINLAKNNKNNDVCFIFLDNAVSSFNGYEVLGQLISDQEVIIIDNISSGNHLIFASKNQCSVTNSLERLNIEYFRKNFNSDNKTNMILNIVKNSCYLGCGELDNNQFYIRNTRSRNDYEINMKRLELIRLALEDYIKN